MRSWKIEPRSGRGLRLQMDDTVATHTFAVLDAIRITRSGVPDYDSLKKSRSGIGDEGDTNFLTSKSGRNRRLAGTVTFGEITCFDLISVFRFCPHMIHLFPGAFNSRHPYFVVTRKVVIIRLSGIHPSSTQLPHVVHDVNVFNMHLQNPKRRYNHRMTSY